MAQGTLRKGLWTEEEDKILKEHVRVHGEGNWITCPTVSGLMRCGKSCRLRWMNHLRPNLRKVAFSASEEEKIVNLQEKYGNKWSLIACQLPGRTDNEIKNYWYTRVKRRERARFPIYPNGATKTQAQDMISYLVPPVVASPEKAHNPAANTPFISIYDILKTFSRKTIAVPSYNGPSNEQIGAADSQMHEVNTAELFSPMSAPIAFGDIGASGYVNGEGVAIAISPLTDDAIGG